MDAPVCVLVERLCVTMWLQSFFKHLLHHGTKICANSIALQQYIHPDVIYLGASPYAKVYYTTTSPSFGLNVQM